MISISYVHFSALSLFLIAQSASGPPKRFFEPADIEKASGPFVNAVLYVDKTSLILKLFQTGSKFFFVRPRRFGKSSFLRALQAVFDGRGRLIFNYTDIHRSDYLWDSHPVLYLDFGNYVIESVETCKELMKEPRSLTLLEKKVNTTFTEFKEMHSLSEPRKTSFPDEFASILKEVKAKGNSTVVLIDEYDFSILNNANSCPIAERISKELVRDIFLQLKDYGGLIKFAFVTGISKSIVSILSTSFDLTDITGTIDFHNIAGLTEADIVKYYGDHLAKVSSDSGKSNDTIITELKQWYNGYRFSEFAPSPLYNPLSVHSYFKSGSAKGYWTDTATANFLFQQMIIRPIDFSLDLKYGTKSELKGGHKSQNETDAALLLYDAGYITIQGFENGDYILRFPNLEMEMAYYRDIAEAALVSQNSTRYEITAIDSSMSSRPVPNFRMFMDAINRGLMKLVIRVPFEEWYSWQTMLLIKKAIRSAERETKLVITRKNKFIDVTGYKDDIYFLIECKLNKIGNSDAWADAKESITAFLKQNKEKRMLLAVGITFSSDLLQDVVSAYQAKLIFPNGTIYEVWDSEDSPNNASNFYREVSYDPMFKHVKRNYTRRKTTTKPPNMGPNIYLVPSSEGYNVSYSLSSNENIV